MNWFSSVPVRIVAVQGSTTELEPVPRPGKASPWKIHLPMLITVPTAMRFCDWVLSRDGNLGVWCGLYIVACCMMLAGYVWITSRFCRGFWCVWMLETAQVPATLEDIGQKAA
jgi:hypothetical protein